MNITGDYHTHSKYSKNNHGKNTIKEMVDYASELGLVSYGVSDHGPKHIFFGIKRKNIEKARQEVDKIKENSKIKVYFGIEANLIGKDGSIDLSSEEIKKLDILLVGYHKGTITDFVNPFRMLFNPKKQKLINTLAYLNMLDKYHVDIITHLNEYIKVDVYKVAVKAKEKGTLIELNNKHIRFNDEEAKQLIDSGCNFILSSDAHKKKNIAKLDRTLEFVLKYNIPLERIVNVDKLYK